MSNSIVGAVRVLLSADTAQYTRGMRRAVRTSEQSAQRIQRVMRVAASAIAALGTGIGVRSFVQAASAAEQYGVRLRVMLRSQSEANRLFREMTEFAGRVPFEFEAIMGSATQLSGILRGGVDEIREVMPVIADLAATTGLSIQQTTEQVSRMFSAGAASADMFRERGVLAMLGFQAGVSYSAEDTRRMLMESWSRTDSQFRGATDQLADTWTGLMSMLSDRWFQFRTEVMRGGLFDALKDNARTALAFIDRNMEGVLRAIRGGIARVQVFASSWAEVLGQMNENTNGLVNDIARRFGWLTSSILSHFIDKVIDGFTHLPTNIRAVVEILIGMVDRFRMRAVAMFGVMTVAIRYAWDNIKHSAEILWLHVQRIFASGVDAVMETVRSLAISIGAVAASLGRTDVARQMMNVAAAARSMAGGEALMATAIENANREQELQNALLADEIALIQASLRVNLASSEAATEAALAERDAILDRYRARIEEARNLRTPESQGGVAPPLQAVAEGVETIEEQVGDSMERISTFSEQAARNIQTAFADFLFDPFDEGLKGMLKGFIDVIRRMIAEAAAAKILGGDGMGSFFSAILNGLGLPNIDGARAMGGPVAAGGSYLVGEKGPEIFMPNTGGRIIPNGASGGGMSIHVTVPADRDPSKDIELAARIGREIMGATEDRLAYGHWPS